MNEVDLEKTHLAGRERYAYFLLAAAGAAVAFAIQKTESAILSWWISPVATAILCWGLSFFCGCKVVWWSQAILSSALNIAQAQSDKNLSEDQRRQSISDHRDALDPKLAKATLYADLQIRLLFAGGVFFCLWRVAEIVRASLPLQHSFC
ncbi:hypothetical protein [Rhodoferax sp. TS-BS-61-7]|uniref:hypothetical protein n=1 Tax=Rhodoferax sp. TS-BS-61-7 TaxID=2094194 RepID=UPI0011B07484|nr:hypothetical protein [Rhodoferax sp. TS-BS-61-7]